MKEDYYNQYKEIPPPYSTRFLIKGILLTLGVFAFFSWAYVEVGKRPGFSSNSEPGKMGGVITLTVVTTPTVDAIQAQLQQAQLQQAQLHAQLQQTEATKEYTLLLLDISEATRVAGEEMELHQINLKQNEAILNEQITNTKRLSFMWYTAGAVLLLCGLCLLCLGIGVTIHTIRQFPPPTPYRQPDLIRPLVLHPIPYKETNRFRVQNGLETVPEVVPAPELVLNEEPDSVTRAYIRQRYEVLKSKSAVCRELWGYKNAQVFSWVDMAINEGLNRVGE